MVLQVVVFFVVEQEGDGVPGHPGTGSRAGHGLNGISFGTGNIYFSTKNELS